MKEEVFTILDKYLKIYPEEKEKQQKFIEFLNRNDNSSIIDWNNFDGHIVASGFMYAKKDKKFLVLYHKDMKKYVYPGGHVDAKDKNIFEAAKREVKEETGLDNFQNINIDNDKLVPMDIDIHHVEINERLNLPRHYHFDFRYLFIIDNISKINQDEEELGDYKWVSLSELNMGYITSKIKKILDAKNL